jgi:hypothetical protein
MCWFYLPCSLSRVRGLGSKSKVDNNAVHAAGSTGGHPSGLPNYSKRKTRQRRSPQLGTEVKNCCRPRVVMAD